MLLFFTKRIILKLKKKYKRQKKSLIFTNRHFFIFCLLNIKFDISTKTMPFFAKRLEVFSWLKKLTEESEKQRCSSGRDLPA